MKIVQTSSTSASLVKFQLEKGESIRIEPGCMVYKDGCINLEGRGKVIIQTRNIQSFVDILVDYIPFPKQDKN